MADYQFLTTWLIDAPVDRVWEILNDSAEYPAWWKGVRSVEILAPGDEAGVGQVSRFSWRSVLPYTLSFDMRVTRVVAPRLIEGEATGELEGRGVWRLYEGAGTAVVYDWRVRTTQAWMNRLGPLARPAFEWNHDLVMRQGGFGLATRLGATLVAHD
ncbi:MAG TPA: SRPBCC family protein [Solirubrobacteraceae bacterium]|nr:SRPBCC family protein [Solirubrobacteraceae bacterium]